jgi:hypothetical protein
MNRLNLSVNNETSRLRAVVLGTTRSNGPVPELKDACDPKSLASISLQELILRMKIWVLEMAVAAIF